MSAASAAPVDDYNPFDGSSVKVTYAVLATLSSSVVDVLAMCMCIMLRWRWWSHSNPHTGLSTLVRRNP